MDSNAEAFKRSVGANLCSRLGSEYRFVKSRLELRALTPDGYNVVILSGSTKYSPCVSIAFYFGRNFGAARQIEKLLTEAPVYYHVQQYSYNLPRMSGLEYSGPSSWEIDIERPPSSLMDELITAIHGMADPFFSRFSSLTAARDAIASDDPWCFGGKWYWRQLLLLDLALDDEPHFERWAQDLDVLQASQAAELLAKYHAVQRERTR